MDMLYVCSCRKCAYLVHHTDVQSVKNLMQSHLEKSHGYEPTSICSISTESRVTDKGVQYYKAERTISFEEFKEDFKIDRIKDDEVIRGLLIAFEHRGFWKALRTNPKKIETPILSGLRSGEFKLFLKSEREQRLRMLELPAKVRVYMKKEIVNCQNHQRWKLKKPFKFLKRTDSHYLRLLQNSFLNDGATSQPDA